MFLLALRPAACETLDEIALRNQTPVRIGGLIEERPSQAPAATAPLAYQIEIATIEAAQASPATPPPPASSSLPPRPHVSLPHALTLCCLVLLVFTLLLSAYSRYHLRTHKQAAFLGPRCLNFLFPRGENPEELVASLYARQL